MAKALKKPVKEKKVSLLEAAMIANTTASMSKPGVAGNLLTKPAVKRSGKESLVDSAVTGATTPPLGKSEKGKSAAEKRTTKR